MSCEKQVSSSIRPSSLLWAHNLKSKCVLRDSSETQPICISHNMQQNLRDLNIRAQPDFPTTVTDSLTYSFHTGSHSPQCGAHSDLSHSKRRTKSISEEQNLNTWTCGSDKAPNVPVSVQFLSYWSSRWLFYCLGLLTYTFTLSWLKGDVWANSTVRWRYRHKHMLPLSRELFHTLTLVGRLWLNSCKCWTNWTSWWH